MRGVRITQNSERRAGELGRCPVGTQVEEVLSEPPPGGHEGAERAGVWRRASLRADEQAGAPGLGWVLGDSGGAGVTGRE